ncbi:hypothetical protein CNMCM8980_001217 [Aspergillus fumigatiaffinis]|uniref:Uncharacterized protein n=1 Tax=Aspergillus fumigatiaffinis TaxID=340414 RepID=A0A8H4M9N2_9EURO|nr:hypothetical protein CNMCM5878_001353 [Aspergillus fumigatiaffinis]KAF4236667.1 hypothetical protein CNMCM6457_002037 [Aspergillus fumigatiaffinis]KAF4241912.1 hypothetical protein CNMCM6805_003449 [Aspergillus fumigatiaffinis]KAF4250331.1 hypothetical protein CNMCM8980_001217 [Aspergillus fumigatiaffinis]
MRAYHFFSSPAPFFSSSMFRSVNRIVFSLSLEIFIFTVFTCLPPAYLLCPNTVAPRWSYIFLPPRPRSSEHYAWHRGQVQLAKNIGSKRRPAPSRDMLLASPSLPLFNVLPTIYHFNHHDNLPVWTGPAG